MQSPTRATRFGVSALYALCLLGALAVRPSHADATPDPLLPTEEARRNEQLRTLKDVPLLDPALGTRPETSAAAWMAALGVALLGGGLLLLRRRRAPVAVAPRIAVAPRAAMAAALEPAVRITNTTTDANTSSHDAERLAALELRLVGLEGSLLQVVESVEQVAVRMEARLDRSARRERRERRMKRAQSQPQPLPAESYSISAPHDAFSLPQTERPAVPRFEGPWIDPPTTSTPMPATPMPATPPAAAPPLELNPRDPRHARELVMGLVRRGYDRAQIQAETRLPAGDVALILTSLRQPAAERAVESARFGR